MKKTLYVLLTGCVLFAATIGAAVPATAAGLAAGGALIDDPEMPAVVAILLDSGFSQSDADALSASFTALLDDSGTAGLDTTGVVVFSRADLVSLGLGDADELDALLRNIGLLYISVTASVVDDPTIGNAIRMDIRVPGFTEQVLGSLLLPYSLVIDPLTFISGLGIDLGGLLF